MNLFRVATMGRGKRTRSKNSKNDLPEDPEDDLKHARRENCCGSCCGGLCATRQLISSRDRENYIRTTFVELIIYLIFLINACIVTFGMISSDSYYFTSVISKLFLDTPFAKDNSVNFRTSSDVRHFWKFTETIMLDGLYWDNWYGVGEKKVPPQDQGVLYENRLLGLPRLRQIRVQQATCPIPHTFRRLVRICYPPYETDLDEKGLYGEIKEENNSTKKTWVHYFEQDSLNGSSYWGKLATYSGGGAYFLLSTNKQDTSQHLDELKNNLWISRSTRVVFLDFTLYNANVNLFCVVKLVWEFPATGGLTTSWSTHTVRLIRYVSNFDYFIFVCELIFCAFTVYYTIQEILELLELGFMGYLSDVWSWLDCTILTISYVCIGFSILRYKLVQSTLEDLVANPSQFADFQFLGFWETQFNNGVAVCMFFIWVKVVKYISFNRTMTQLSSTLSRCAKDIVGFSFLFFLTFFAFVQLGYLLFGSQVKDFSTFGDSTFTLLRLILGDFNFREIEAANRILGPIFFLAYVFFVFFVLLNVFLAIINDTYSEVKAEIQAQRNEFQLADYIKRGFNNLCGIFGHRSKQIDVEQSIKLAAAEGQITYSELRRNLHNAHFTDVEIEMFLARYELDQDRALDEDEIHQVLADLEGEKIVLDKSSRVSKESGKLGIDVPHEISLMQEENEDIQRRTNAMENAISGLNQKIDSLISKLEMLDRR